MSGYYVKLYSTIITSSIWIESHATLRVWITMLTLADKNGQVAGSHGGLAHIANVSREDFMKAIEVLSAPDPDSRTPDDDGRRVRKIEGGWFVINAEKYRDMRTETQVEWAEKKRLWREQNEAQKASGDMSEDIQDSPKMSEDKTTALSLALSLALSETETTTALSDKEPESFNEAWKSFPKKAGGNARAKALRCYKARLKEGIPPESLLSGVQRYATYIRATGKEGSDFVQLGATFFGPDRHWEEPWTLPVKPQKKQTEQDRNAEVLDNWLAEKEARNG